MNIAGRLLIPATVAVVLPLALILAVVAGHSPAAASDGGVSVLARRDIPARYLAWYRDAAATCPGLSWSVLAGVGKVESNHGRSRAPGVRSGHNSAGAEGPMQFEPATFRRYAVDGDRDGVTSVYDPADAIFTAARMLCADGARGGSAAGVRRALFAYNHAGWYVREVLAWAARYAAAPAGSGAAGKAIAWAKRQLGTAYVYGGDCTDAQRQPTPHNCDCSSLVQQAYAHAGITIARTTYAWRQDGPTVPLDKIRPGDLLFSAGSDGTRARPGHVVMYLGGGKVIEAPHTGTDVRISALDKPAVVVATRPADLATSR